MSGGFDRVMISISMREPIEGIPVVLLEQGALLTCENGSPPFQLTTEIKLGVGCTVFTDAECTEPGSWGTPAGSIVEVAGYPRKSLVVSQREPATGGARLNGQIVNGIEVLNAIPETTTALAVKDPRYAQSEAEEARIVLRMNLDHFDSMGNLSSAIYAVVNRDRAPEMAEVYANFVRMVVVSHGTPIMMGFRNTKLVYLSLGGAAPVLTKLAPGTRLFLQSEAKRLGAG